MLRITETEQLLRQYSLDWPDFLELSNQGATLIMSLFTEAPTSDLSEKGKGAI